MKELTLEELIEKQKRTISDIGVKIEKWQRYLQREIDKLENYSKQYEREHSRQFRYMKGGQYDQH